MSSNVCVRTAFTAAFVLVEKLLKCFMGEFCCHYICISLNDLIHQTVMQFPERESIVFGFKGVKNLTLIPYLTLFPTNEATEALSSHYKDSLEKTSGNPRHLLTPVGLRPFTFWPELMLTFSLTFVSRQTETLQSSHPSNCRLFVVWGTLCIFCNEY